MPVVPAACWGINIYHARLTACLHRIDATGEVTQDVRACATADGTLLT